MGAKTKQNHRLLDYQLSDFLELRLGNEGKKKISKLKSQILKASGFKGASLYEFPAVGTPNTCVILPNGFSKKLKKLCLVNPDGSLKEVKLK